MIAIIVISSSATCYGFIYTAGLFEFEHHQPYIENSDNALPQISECFRFSYGYSWVIIPLAAISSSILWISRNDEVVRYGSLAYMAFFFALMLVMCLWCALAIYLANQSFVFELI